MRINKLDLGKYDFANFAHLILSDLTSSEEVSINCVKEILVLSDTFFFSMINCAKERSLNLSQICHCYVTFLH